jgi:hypothetical protein
LRCVSCGASLVIVASTAPVEICATRSRSFANLFAMLPNSHRTLSKRLHRAKKSPQQNKKSSSRKSNPNVASLNSSKPKSPP